MAEHHPEASAPEVPVCYRHPGRESHIRCQRCGRPICPECMTPASVGFQCPECLAEGRASVRTPRRSFRIGGSVAPVTMTLIGINVLVFLLVQVASGTVLYDLMMHARSVCSVQGGYIPLENTPLSACGSVGGTLSRGVADGGYWELLTSVFTHQQLLHVALNMFSLWMIGPLLETGLGRTRYLITYLLCGLAGSALVYWAASPITPTLGASGAIFGLLGALIVLFARRGLQVGQLVIVAVLNFVLTFSNSAISWQAHVGGFVAGLVIGAIFAYTPGVRRRGLQWTGIAAVAGAVVIAVVLRSAQLA
ncbi:rhomboid family intramembrane serine protease [Nocardioides sp. BP30]|uniref:rhomboid family intramembrane serine protease n=1 Tax=Nocardioides sp. BP30 TaxID=3036374 RepID=UPI002468B80A|nr:rhomboid family intramembrane serine protease [Nocardioides sp. BP30]WGL52574.1 rhomboid family intramembrane serine protease [Nocardioides sp. BP30]